LIEGVRHHFVTAVGDLERSSLSSLSFDVRQHLIQFIPGLNEDFEFAISEAFV